MSNKINLEKSSASNMKVPWEPYKAATNSKKSSTSKKPNSFNHFNAIATSPIEDIKQESLIRYKVSTDLDLFNAKRPGYQFDDFDFQKIENKSSNETSDSKLNFVDARFYPDMHFLKLANDLKKKCLETSGISALPNKPVNIVVPLIEKKLDKPANQSQAQNTDGLSSVKMLKAQIGKYEQKIEYLENQVKGVHEQLQIQTQVNSELKKLLVASIGEDIQYKLERLVSDKQRYEIELENYSKQFGNLNEELEQVEIRCDLWRSKFLACRMMSDEASAWKAFLLLLNRQNDKVLKNLVADNELLNDKLNQALSIMDDINSSKDESTRPKRNLNNLLAANSLIAGLSLIRNRNLANLNNFKPETWHKTTKMKTSNETIAAQMLEQFDWLRHAIQSPNLKTSDGVPELVDSFDKLESLISRLKVSRSTIHSRLYQSTEINQADLFINVCNRCTGLIKVV